MLFLGTGAAELAPNPLCPCPRCERLRAEGAAPRKRSAFLLDARNIIDFGPDVLAASQQYGAPLYDLDNLFLTHTHEDHLCYTNIEVLSMTPERKKTLNVYLSERAKAHVRKYFAAMRALDPAGCATERLVLGRAVTFRAVTPGKEFTAGGMKVLPFESNHVVMPHGEHALNYVFDRGAEGKLLYACDTGLYGERQYKALSGLTLSTIVFEGTFGAETKPRDGGHMTAEFLVEQIDRMCSLRIIDENTRVFITHINQAHSFTPAEYQAYLDANARHKATVAWDGMAL